MARKTDADGTVSESGNRAIQNYDRRKLVCGKTEIASRTEPTTPAMIVYDNLICTPGVCLLRRSALAQLTEGGKPLFDAAFQPLDDWDFWLRVTALGNLAFVDRVVLDWRRHDNAGSQNTSAMSDAELRIREHLVSADLPPELHEVALERYRKLTATRKRRAARDKFNAANVLFRKGKIGGGIASWGAGVAAYAQYLRSK